MREAVYTKYNGIFGICINHEYTGSLSERGGPGDEGRFTIIAQ